MSAEREKILNDQLSCIVAIDGTAASGKGTIASMIAERFNLLYCQSSIFYRMLGLKVLLSNIDPHDVNSVVALLKNGEETSGDIYSEEVTRISSIIASIPEVREGLFKAQRDFIDGNKRVVMEGRDIGTVIAPDADIKIYITASLAIRAERRWQQMVASGKAVTLDEVHESLRLRDERDQTRSHAPLKPAEDAIIVDSSHMTPDEIIENILNLI